jgi:V/A-type H+-transporting ATPase subunit C
LKNTDFVTVSSYIRTQENKLVSRAKLESLLSMDTFPEVLNALSQGTDYNFAAVKSMQQAEEILQAELQRIYQRGYEISPHREVVDLLRCKYDYQVLKGTLKAQVVGLSHKDVPQGASGLSPESIHQSILNADQAPLDKELKVIIEEADKILKEQGVQEQDIYLDKKMYESMIELAGKIDSPVITKHVQMQIDYYNIKTLLRAREMKRELLFFEKCFAFGGTISKDVFMRIYNVPLSVIAAEFTYKYCNVQVQKGIEEYNITRNFAELEILLNNSLLEQIRAAKYISFGAEVLYAYILAKEAELRQIRILLTCKSKGISSTILKRKLGDSYV